jgi:MFS family permease
MLGSNLTADVQRPVLGQAWRWVHVSIAALAMVLTLPGRTQGLGLFTEPLLKDLALDRESYGFCNLWATLLGALFCVPCGWLMDRFGTRVVFLGVTTALGAVVWSMSWIVTGAWTITLAPDPDVTLVIPVDLFLFLLLTRGLGQSALSVVSLALIGRAAGKRGGLAMGLFAFATAIGYMAAYRILGRPEDWRPSWAGIGITVLGLGLAGGLLIRDRLLASGRSQPGERTDEASFSLGQALLSPTFWTFSIATSFLGMVLAGTSLFGESLAAERGLTISSLADSFVFQKMVFVNVLLVGIPFGLTANLLSGAVLWWAGPRALPRVMALATALFGLALWLFPLVTTELQIYIYGAIVSTTGGAMSVCFYSVYRRAFGPAKLGSIQGMAQMLTVLFSAAGPLVFASAKTRLGGYGELFPSFGVIAIVMAAITLFVGLPRQRPRRQSEDNDGHDRNRTATGVPERVAAAELAPGRVPDPA